MKKTTLVILDGFGINNVNCDECAINQAITPTFDKLFAANKFSRLEASGKSVGVPDGQIGSSEIGHMTIGAGRIVKQTIVKIDDMLDDGNFSKLSELARGLEHIKKNNSRLHLFQLFGNGGVHAYSTHLEKILALIPVETQVFLHLFGDGRDLAPDSMLGLFEEFERNILSKYNNVKVATISGRYWGMDRDNNWERIEKSYTQIVHGTNKTDLTPIDFIKKSYNEGIQDEFLEPTTFDANGIIQDNDVIFHLNFRSDRATQLTKVFVDHDFREFETKKLQNIYYVAMTKYYKEYSGDYFIKDEDVKNILGELLSNLGLKQLHLAETEKFVHVTKFFNGGKSVVFDGEQDILVPSHKVATYDLDPEMSAEEIYYEYTKNVIDFDFTVVNFANGDMVGHTGFMSAAVKAVEKLDNIIERMIDFATKNNIELIITADHGNCEEMGNSSCPKTAHTLNDVPCFYISGGEVVKLKEKGGLYDIAPTVLDIMGIEKPVEMAGNSLR